MADQNEGRQVGGRGGSRSFEVIWGSNQGGLLMRKLPDWEEDLNVTAGAGICCGVHLLLVRHIQRVNVVIEAPAEWGQALLNGPASFVVWVNRPGTIDFSVGLVANPWMTIGEQRPEHPSFLLPLCCLPSRLGPATCAAAIKTMIVKSM